MMKVAVLLLLLIVCTIGTDFIPIATLDAFEGTQTPLIIVTPSTPVFPIVQMGFYQTGTIFGGERDLELTVYTSAPSRVFSTTAANGQFDIATPNGGQATVIYQLDGVDGSMNLNPNGLKNLDLTFGGNATAFYIVADSDIATQCNILVYTPTNSMFGNYTQIIPSSFGNVEFIIPYTDFATTGSSGSWNNVGAIELIFEALDNTDAMLTYFGIIGQ